MLFPDDTANLSAHELRVRLLRTQAHRDGAMGAMAHLLATIIMVGSVGNASPVFPLPFVMIISTITLLSGFAFYFRAWRRFQNSAHVRNIA